MLFKLLIPFTLGTVIGVRAMPVFDFPDFIHRAEIPIGVVVYEYNATTAAFGAAAAPKLESRGSLEERDDCHGSSECLTMIKGADCIKASNLYESNSYYCGYTSRWWYHCTAIYRCFGGYIGCLKGSLLQDSFAAIYNVQKCKKCGSYDIPNPENVLNCQVTYNYSFHGKNAGEPTPGYVDDGE